MRVKETFSFLLSVISDNTHTADMTHSCSDVFRVSQSSLYNPTFPIFASASNKSTCFVSQFASFCGHLTCVHTHCASLCILVFDTVPLCGTFESFCGSFVLIVIFVCSLLFILHYFVMCALCSSMVHLSLFAPTLHFGIIYHLYSPSSFLMTLCGNFMSLFSLLVFLWLFCASLSIFCVCVCNFNLFVL